jgi:O-antigen ligase
MLSFKSISFVALGVSITFGGYYALMALFLFATGTISGTRIITMPLRVVILVLLFGGYIGLRRRKSPGLTNRYDLAFLIFAALYMLRIVIELFGDSASSGVYRPPIEILFYFASFVVLPFLLISRLTLTTVELDRLMNFTLLGLLLFSLFSTLAHADFIRSGLRYAIVFGEENVMSPLFLSYCGALGIGLGMAAVLRERRLTYWTIVGLITSVVSLVPFFMGASRGSIIAAALPILFVVVAMRGRLALLASIAAAMIILAMVFASNYLGGSPFARFLSIQESIQSEAGEASRIVLWESSMQQFWEAPIFGSSLENLAFHYYPHNIFLEVMISTGMLGLAPFAILIFMSIRKCFTILTDGPRHFWVVILFLQSLTQSLFSGALYLSSWLAISLALVAVVWRSLSSDHRHPSDSPLIISPGTEISQKLS